MLNKYRIGKEMLFIKKFDLETITNLETHRERERRLPEYQVGWRPQPPPGQGRPGNWPQHPQNTTHSKTRSNNR